MSTLRSIATPSRNFRNERVFPLPDATPAPTAALCFKWLPGPVRLGVSEKMGWKKLGCCFLKVFAVHHFWGCLMISEHIRMWFLVFWKLEPCVINMWNISSLGADSSVQNGGCPGCWRCWKLPRHIQSWLVVSNMKFIFHYIWDNPSHWLSYFSRWLLHHQPEACFMCR